MNRSKALLVLALLSCSIRANAQSDALFIDSQGKVGIGVAEPKEELDVNGKLMLRDSHMIYNSRYGIVDFGDVSDESRFIIRSLKTQGDVEHYDDVFSINKNGNAYIRGDLDFGGKLYANGSMFLSRDISYGISMSNVPNRMQVSLFGWDGVTIGSVSGNRNIITVLPYNVGIGTISPKALFDIGFHLNEDFSQGGQLGTVLARLKRWDTANSGTYLGVRAYADSGINVKSFALEYVYGGFPNSSINFHKGFDNKGGFITFSTYDNTERMRIGPDGKVGIGREVAEAGLDVGLKPDYPATRYAFIDGLSGYVGKIDDNRAVQPLAILGRGTIGTDKVFVIYSDARIKNKIGVSDSRGDLMLLNKLKVTDYKYIDEVKYGSEDRKGFIAQEVEAVFPQAVERGNEYIPNVYATPTQVIQNGNEVLFAMKKDHHLSTGDVVKIMTEKGEELDTITTATNTTFTIAYTGSSYINAFVYGKRVTDFRRVDYDRLFTLNVSATQQLSKDMKTQGEEMDKLKTENEELRNDLKLLKQQLGGIIAKLGYDNAAMTASVPK